MNVKSLIFISHTELTTICMLGVLMSDKEPIRASCYMPRSFHESAQLSIIMSYSASSQSPKGKPLLT